MKNKIILIIVTAVFLAYWYFYHPIPKYDGHMSIGGLNKSVDIYTDTYGVPHIFAQNEEVDLTGVIDMHVHAGPDSRPRAMNDWEAVRMAEAAGLRAVLLKNHFTMTRDQ